MSIFIIPEYPRLIHSINLPELVEKLYTEQVNKIVSYHNTEYYILFVLTNDGTGNITRAIQEDEILKTKIQMIKNNRIITLPSFYDVWKTKKDLSNIILSSSDPNEEKWKCSRSFGYKLATTFMPLYAKSIYEHFHAKKVLDPCSGWGDRLLGASISSCVTNYIGFDPNINLQPGYKKIIKLLDNKKTFQYECIPLPFEQGVLDRCSLSLKIILRMCCCILSRRLISVNLFNVFHIFT